MDWKKASEKTNVFSFVITAAAALIAVGKWLLESSGSRFSAVATTKPTTPPFIGHHTDYLPILLIVALIVTYGFAGIAYVMARRRSTSEEHAPVKYVDHDFDRDLTSTATYKSKFVVSLMNSLSRPIHVLAPSWISQRGDVGLKTDFAAGYWLTRNGTRVDNIPEPTIEPNETFQIWIGLDEAPDLAALQRRKRGRQLGTLRIPIEGVNGKELVAFERRF